MSVSKVVVSRIPTSPKECPFSQRNEMIYYCPFRSRMRFIPACPCVYEEAFASDGGQRCPFLVSVKDLIQVSLTT